MRKSVTSGDLTAAWCLRLYLHLLHLYLLHLDPLHILARITATGRLAAIHGQLLQSELSSA